MVTTDLGIVSVCLLEHNATYRMKLQGFRGIVMNRFTVTLYTICVSHNNVLCALLKWLIMSPERE